MLKSFSFAAALLSSAVLLATNHPNPGGVGISADYLYLRPSIDDTYFVLKAPASTNFPSGKRLNNDFGYRSGYRVAAIYAFCECDAEAILSYSHLSANKSQTVFGQHLWATTGSPDFSSPFEDYEGSARSKLHITYNRLDPLFSQRIFSSCGLDLRALVGFEYANMKLKERTRYATTTLQTNLDGTLRSKSSSWGFGPQIGLAADYQLWEFTECVPGTLSFNAVSTASLLVGHSHSSNFSSRILGANPETIFSDIEDKKAWRVIPALHLRMELNYATAVCGMPAALAIGYEFNSYIRSLGRSTFVDDVGDGLCTTSYDNYDVQGLYVSLSASF